MSFYEDHDYEQDEVGLCKFCGDEIVWDQQGTRNDPRWVPLDPGNLERHVCRERRRSQARDDFA